MLVGNRIRQNLLTHTRFWYLINAKDQINGRLAAYAATILQGKTKPIWHPKVDVGDFLVIINTKKVAFTGKKWDRKVYRHHTGRIFYLCKLSNTGNFKSVIKFFFMQVTQVDLRRQMPSPFTRRIQQECCGVLLMGCYQKTKTESCTCHVYFYLRMKIILMQKTFIHN